MKVLLLTLLTVPFINLNLCAPTDFINNAVKPLTENGINLLKTWTETSVQNIWEISGQFEGDIIFLPNTPLEGLWDQVKTWPNRTVPYQFEDDGVFSVEQKNFITETLKQFNKKTCITVRPKILTDSDYVAITALEAGCYSSVGRQGGAQQINFQPDAPGSGCLRNGTILHEFIHALGFYHQQSALERDLYISVQKQNIEEGDQQNFEIYGSNTGAKYGVTYDYGSVMHYGAYAFSKNGKKTIEVLRLNTTIGQRNGFSAKDIIKLNRMYGCDPYFPSNY